MKKMTKYTCITVYITGLRSGYIRISDRKESDFIAIPATLKGIRGNLRWALEKIIAQGCTHYTTQDYQTDSTQYCFTIYRGYKEETK